MKVDLNGIWYHGSNKRFEVLKKGSTITQWKELAEAFSHKPTYLEYDDTHKICHNGAEKGYLYVIDEAIIMDKDVCVHPASTMEKNMEFLTKRDLKIKLIQEF
jgi:hypothetical protein